MDFEGENTMRPVSCQPQPNEWDEIYSDAVLNISRESVSVFKLKSKWERKPSMLNLTPDFQRGFVWNVKQKSELIESILMGIPLPLIYVKEDENGVYIIVDGRQRLNTLFTFINDEYPLERLTILRNKNGKKFSQLSLMEQNCIEDCSLTLQVIKAPTSDIIAFDLFDRVNRGGIRLNNQEMRNALYQGNSTELIDRLALKETFVEATERSIPSKRMKDRYLVLRFIAFYLWQKHISIDVDTKEPLEYKSDMEDFLGKTMRYLNKLNANDQLLNDLEKDFDKAMTAALKLLPLGGFRLWAKKSGNRPVNMAFFESFSWFLSQMDGDNDELIRNVYNRLQSDGEYLYCLTHSIDSRNHVVERYEIINQIIKEI